MKIHCPKCECACPEEEEVCPGCGHALGSVEDPPVSHEEKSVYQEIGAVRVLGALMVVAGLLCFAFIPVAGVWGVGSGLTLLYLGVLTRCLGGIWATLERIARK